MAAADSFIISDVPPRTSHEDVDSLPSVSSDLLHSEEDEDLSPPTDHDDVDSLPSISSSLFSSEEESDAQREWETSLEQLQLLLTMVLIPFVGKYFGRKFAYWSWARYMEWAHNVEVRWTNKKAFKVAGAVEVAATL